MSRIRQRHVHIDGQQWIWVVESERWYGAVKEVRIYSPTKILYRVNPKELTTERMWVGVEGDFATNIKPYQVKNYIIKEIKNG